MKKTGIITLIAITVSLLFTSCLNTVVNGSKRGNGELVTKSIDISGFSKIEIETRVKIDYSQEKNRGNLEFTIDDNLWEYYNIYTKNDVLHIKLKDQFRNKTHPNPTKSLITVSSEQLEKIDIAGSADVHFNTAFVSEKLRISIAGNGNIFANEHPVQIEDCKIDIAGNGNINFAGAIQKARIDIAGNGKVKALDCEIAQLNISIAGNGDAEVSVTDKLDISIAGSGSVKYKGNPKEIESSVSGSGKIVKL